MDNLELGNQVERDGRDHPLPGACRRHEREPALPVPEMNDNVPGPSGGDPGERP